MYDSVIIQYPVNILFKISSALLYYDDVAAQITNLQMGLGISPYACQPRMSALPLIDHNQARVECLSTKFMFGVLKPRGLKWRNGDSQILVWGEGNPGTWRRSDQVRLGRTGRQSEESPLILFLLKLVFNLLFFWILLISWLSLATLGISLLSL